MNNKKLIAAAAFGLMVGALASSPAAQAKSKAPVGKCTGVNSCKGKGACKTDKNDCKGKNGCKGQGWVKMTEAKCTKKKGTFEALPTT